MQLPITFVSFRQCNVEKLCPRKIDADIQTANHKYILRYTLIYLYCDMFRLTLKKSIISPIKFTEEKSSCIPHKALSLYTVEVSTLQFAKVKYAEIIEKLMQAESCCNKAMP